MTTLTAIWGARSAPLTDCATKVTQLVERWMAIDPALAKWHETGESRAAARVTHVDLTRDSESLLERGTLRNDDGDVVPGGGFSLGLWGEIFGEDVGLSADLGVTSPNLPGNSCRLGNLPEKWTDPGLDAESIHPLLDPMIEVFHPSFASAQSLRASDDLFDADLEFPTLLVGELTYLSLDAITEVPHGLSATPWHHGVVIDAQQAMGSTSSEALVEIANRIRTVLRD